MGGGGHDDEDEDDDDDPSRPSRSLQIFHSESVSEASWGHRRALLGPSWAALGAVLGALGAVLGLLGTILRPPEPIGRERATKHKT
eukprot:2959309-Pyramimonas_sp.AAC.1